MKGRKYIFIGAVVFITVILYIAAFLFLFTKKERPENAITPTLTVTPTLTGGITPTVKVTVAAVDDEEAQTTVTKPVMPTSKPTNSKWEKAKNVKFEEYLSIDIMYDTELTSKLDQKVSYLYSKYLGLDEYRAECFFKQEDAEFFEEKVHYYVKDYMFYANYRCLVLHRADMQTYMEHKTFRLYYNTEGLQIEIVE